MSRIARNTLLLSVAALLLIPAAAFAAGTPSGTPVRNSATVDYQVGGIAQTQIASNQVEFTVDNRIDLTVTTVDAGAVTVLPGSTRRLLTFLVTNTGNTVQDFRLQVLDAAAAAFGLTETFDAVNVQVWADDNLNGAYDPDRRHPQLRRRAGAGRVDARVRGRGHPRHRGRGRRGLVRPAGRGGHRHHHRRRWARTWSRTPAWPTTRPSCRSSSATAPAQIDAARDASFSSRDSYLVANANLTIAKSSLTVEDPFNGATNPKAIPGARVTYTLDVSNTGTGAADNVSIVDMIPAFTVFRVGSLVTAGTALFSNDGGTTFTYTPVADADGNDPDVDYIQVDYGLIAGGGATEQITFDVVIQ